MASCAMLIAQDEPDPHLVVELSSWATQLEVGDGATGVTAILPSQMLQEALTQAQQHSFQEMSHEALLLAEQGMPQAGCFSAFAAG